MPSKYKVVNDFIDAYQAGTSYKKGDEYPKDGYEVTKERLEFLSSEHPEHKQVFIEEVKQTSKKNTTSNKKTSSKAKDDEE